MECFSADYLKQCLNSYETFLEENSTYTQACLSLTQLETGAMLVLKCKGQNTSAVTLRVSSLADLVLSLCSVSFWYLNRPDRGFDLITFTRIIFSFMFIPQDCRLLPQVSFPLSHIPLPIFVSPHSHPFRAGNQISLLVTVGQTISRDGSSVRTIR